MQWRLIIAAPSILIAALFGVRDRGGWRRWFEVAVARPRPQPGCCIEAHVALESEEPFCRAPGETNTTDNEACSDEIPVEAEQMRCDLGPSCTINSNWQNVCTSQEIGCCGFQQPLSDKCCAR